MNQERSKNTKAYKIIAKKTPQFGTPIQKAIKLSPQTLKAKNGQNIFQQNSQAIQKMIKLSSSGLL
jgi:hypothetical protein